MGENYWIGLDYFVACEKRANTGRQKKSRDRPEATVGELLFVQT